MTVASESKSRKCVSVKEDGTRCKAWAMKDSAYCYLHNPEIEAERAERLSAGGKARHGRSVHVESQEMEFEFRSIDDLKRLFETAVNDTLKLDNSISRNSALARMVATGVKIVEAVDLQTQIKQIEARLEYNERYFNDAQRRLMDQKLLDLNLEEEHEQEQATAW